jgi:hypothetical protein
VERPSEDRSWPFRTMTIDETKQSSKVACAPLHRIAQCSGERHGHRIVPRTRRRIIRCHEAMTSNNRHRRNNAASFPRAPRLAAAQRLDTWLFIVAGIAGFRG